MVERLTVNQLFGGSNTHSNPTTVRVFGRQQGRRALWLFATDLIPWMPLPLWWIAARWSNQKISIWRHNERRIEGMAPKRSWKPSHCESDDGSIPLSSANTALSGLVLISYRKDSACHHGQTAQRCDRHYGRRSSTIASSILATLFQRKIQRGLGPFLT